MKKLNASSLGGYSGKVRVVYKGPESVAVSEEGVGVVTDYLITGPVELVRYDRKAQEITIKRPSGQAEIIKPIEVFEV